MYIDGACIACIVEVYMYVYMYIYMHMYTYIYIYACIYMYIHIHIYIRICIYVNTYTHISTYMYRYIYMGLCCLYALFGAHSVHTTWWMYVLPTADSDAWHVCACNGRFRCMTRRVHLQPFGYGVASVSRLLNYRSVLQKSPIKEMIFCKMFKEPTNRSHPIQFGTQLIRIH